MSYSDGEALILTQVQATTSFSSSNTSRANWKLLNKGKSGQYAILRPGEFEREHFGLGGNYSTNWVTICEVWVRYKDDSTSLTNLEAKSAEIIERFDEYRLAADGTGNVRDVFVRSGTEPEEMWTAGGNGPSWLRQTLSIEWSEERTVTLAE